MALMRRTRVPQHIEDAILALAAEQPVLGRVRVATELNRRGLEATPATVRSVWQRHGLQNTEKRIKAFTIAADEAATLAPIPTEDRVVIPAPHEIAAVARPASGLMADALVFSVAVLTALSHDSTNTFDQPAGDSLHNDQILAVLGEDRGVIADAPVETTDIFQFFGSHSDLLAA